MRTAAMFTLGVLTAMVTACGGTEPGPGAATAAAQGDDFTGNLTVSATSVQMGSTITVTETATNLTGSSIGPIIVGIRRLGFDVVAVQKPRTGICRIAGSATCNFLQLAPWETQSYTLTLAPTAPGTYQIQGWTRTSSTTLTGGFFGAVNVTVY